MTDRERLGRTVRETWVAWALEQPDPKPSWLVPWEDLDDGQREVDMRIGEAIAETERERFTRLLDTALITARQKPLGLRGEEGRTLSMFYEGYAEALAWCIQRARLDT